MPESHLVSRVAVLEEWRRNVHGDLYGRNGGEIGLIREHRESRAESRGQARLMKICTIVVSSIASLLGLFHGLQFFHIIK